MKRIYLDYAATTPTHPEVVKAMQPYFSEIFGNPSSLHLFGQEAKTAVDETRKKLAQFIGAQPEEVVFTSGGTESDNFAIKGVANALQRKGNHIITSPIEHHAVLETCHFLEKLGFKTTFLPVDKYGMVDPEDVKKAITSKTILITVMHANNEIGTVQPIAEIGRVAREAGIYFHTDAVQTFGHLRTDVDELNVDLMSVSAHKLYGPKGVGFIYIRKDTQITPIMHGGGQEDGRRGSTHNVPGIMGLGKAIEIASKEMDEEAERLTALRARLTNGLLESMDFIHLNGHPIRRLPNNVNVSIEFIEGEAILLSLDYEGIGASTGSACSSGSLEPSHVLTTVGVPPEVARCSLRFSLGKWNTEDDINIVLEALPRVVAKLRAMSPLYKQRRK